MTTKPEALAAALGIAVPPKPKPGWCRGVGCGEKLDPILIDRPDGSGLHALCTELVEPARFAGRPSEPEALDLLRSKLGAQPIQTVPLPECICGTPGTGNFDGPLRDCPVHGEAGPCTDPWCAKNGRPCGYDVPAHINAHGPKLLTNPNVGPGKPYRVLVTGSRTWTDDALIWGTLNDLHREHGSRLVIVHGACPHGADAVADAWCQQFGVPAEQHPADWHGLGKSAGFKRNQSMVDSRPDRCVAFIHNDSAGATHCATAAEAAGIPTTVHRVPAPVTFSAPAPLEPEPVERPAFSAPAGAHPLKAEMIKIIRWYDSSRPRSLQREIGMSEVGVDCLRRLAYSLAEVPPVNTAKDPWFAIVGTAVHAWLADALTAWSASEEYGGPVFQVEQRVTATDGTVVVPGSTDFYRNAVVGDHKVVGPDALKRTKDNGPSNQYRTQLHLNGLGWEQAGWPVDTVALLLYPRSGYLDGMHVWSEPYNRQVALDALARLSSVRAISTALGVGNVPASPDKAGCVWCPFYRPGAPADATGCPGK